MTEQATTTNQESTSTSQQETSQNTTSQTSTSENNERLYAGKYKTVEELEEGYKNNSRAMTMVKDLETKIESLTKAPEQYLVPDGITIPENELNEMKAVAAKAKLSQDAFANLVTEMNSRTQEAAKVYEETRKALGDSTVNILNDYIKKHYPENLHNEMMARMIMDKDARAAALAHREQLLNSSVRGMDGVNNNNYRVTKEDQLKARKELEDAKSKGEGSKTIIALQQKYLTITKALAHQQKQ